MDKQEAQRKVQQCIAHLRAALIAVESDVIVSTLVNETPNGDELIADLFEAAEAVSVLAHKEALRAILKGLCSCPACTAARASANLRAN